MAESETSEHTSYDHFTAMGYAVEITDFHAAPGSQEWKPSQVVYGTSIEDSIADYAEQHTAAFIAEGIWAPHGSTREITRRVARMTPTRAATRMTAGVFSYLNYLGWTQHPGGVLTAGNGTTGQEMADLLDSLLSGSNLKCLLCNSLQTPTSQPG